jgi:hypothetical protein
MKKLIALIALSMGLAHAGEMRTTVDNFTGVSTTQFIGIADNVIYVIGRRTSDMATLLVRPGGEITDCTRYPVLVKTADSKIHSFKATEINSRSCGIVLNYELLKNGIMVRIPLYNKGDKDASIDTANLDWESMGTRKIEQ